MAGRGNNNIDDSDRCKGAGMGNREENIWRGLGKEDEDVRMVGRECYRFWDFSVGMERVGKGGGGAGEVYEIGIGGGWEDAAIHGEGRREKGQDEDKIGEGGSEV